MVRPIIEFNLKNMLAMEAYEALGRIVEEIIFEKNYICSLDHLHVINLNDKHSRNINRNEGLNNLKYVIHGELFDLVYPALSKLRQADEDYLFCQSASSQKDVFVEKEWTK